MPWQQLSVQPSLQQVCPHLSLQQFLQAMAFAAKGVWASAPMASKVPNESNAMVRFMKFSFTLNSDGFLAGFEAASMRGSVRSDLDPEHLVKQIERRGGERSSTAGSAGKRGWRLQREGVPQSHVCG